MLKKMLALSLCALVSGCFDKTPSTSEIEGELKRSFSSCDLVTVSNVKKLNGEASENPNFYSVQAEFNLKFRPISDAEERKSKLDLLKVEANEANQKWIKLAETLEVEHRNRSDRYAQMGRDIRSQANAFLSDAGNSDSDKMSVRAEAIAKLEQLEEEKSKEYRTEEAVKNKADLLGKQVFDGKLEVRREFEKQCRITDKFANRVVGRAVIDDVIKVDEIPFGGEFTFEYTIPMKKTEKGWFFNL